MLLGLECSDHRLSSFDNSCSCNTVSCITTQSVEQWLAGEPVFTAGSYATALHLTYVGKYEYAQDRKSMADGNPFPQYQDIVN